MHETADDGGGEISPLCCPCPNIYYQTAARMSGSPLLCICQKKQQNSSGEQGSLSSQYRNLPPFHGDLNSSLAFHHIH